MLHVDTANELGLTIGFYLMSPVLTTDHRLWDRYWALGPSVALFWKLNLSGPLLDEFTHNSRWLRETSVVWEDLELVNSFAHLMPTWMREEVRRRIRGSARFGWMAAVVLAA